MDPRKAAAQWARQTVFQEEPIPQRPEKPRQKVPAPILAARCLEPARLLSWGEEVAVFYQQGKLLENFRDDYPETVSVKRYYPTYQTLTNEELRCYFTWRTRLRQGQVEKTCLSFAFLYIYELINQIGVKDPADGYRKLEAFARDYGPLDSAVMSYLEQWLTDYVIYYQLPGKLLENTPQAAFDRGVLVLRDMEQYSDGELAQAASDLAPSWLGRSRFCREHRQDVDQVLCRVLRRLFRHYAARCKKTLVEQFFGPWQVQPLRLFASTPLYQRNRGRVITDQINPVRVYRCSGSYWTVQEYDSSKEARQPLENLVKTVDCEMRKVFDDRHPIQPCVKTKWIMKIIQEEVAGLSARKQAAEAKKLHLDYGKLDQIRRDAAITQDRLTVEEEPEAPVQPQAEAPQAPPEDGPSLTGDERRLLQCLLYGGALDWIRQEGLTASILVDRVNEKLFDTFQDNVLEDPPQVVEDYTEDLKEMVHP